MIGLPRPSDLDFLHLEVGPDMRHSGFELVADLARHDGALYGGTTIPPWWWPWRRPPVAGVWATTQYVAMARLGAVVERTTGVLAMAGILPRCSSPGGTVTR